MDRTERFHIIDQMLNNARCVSRQQFLEALEISPATFKRDLEYLRDRLGAPIVWDRESRGYCYWHEHSDQPFQLPGLWFNSGEIHALLTMQAWLDNVQPGLLSGHIEPLKARIRALLDSGAHDGEQITRRIRIQTRARIAQNSAAFQVLGQALLKRKQVRLEHYNRARDSSSERIVSPQRLTYYRDNWYLDSWCHLRHAIRSFAVDAIHSVAVMQDSAKDISEDKLDQELQSGYGIFSGSKIKRAKLKFTPERARWVAQEQWHPQQESYVDTEGYYYLTVPYSQEPELVMDLLKHGAQVEVLEPASLRARMKQAVQAMSELYT